MDGIAGAGVGMGDQDVARPVRVRQGYRDDGRTDLDEQVVHVARKIHPAQCAIAIENLLEDLGAGEGLDLSVAHSLKEPS